MYFTEFSFVGVRLWQDRTKCEMEIVIITSKTRQIKKSQRAQFCCKRDIKIKFQMHSHFWSWYSEVKLPVTLLWYSQRCFHVCIPFSERPFDTFKCVLLDNFFCVDLKSRQNCCIISQNDTILKNRIISCNRLVFKRS